MCKYIMWVVGYVNWMIGPNFVTCRALIICWLMNSVSQVKNTPIVRKDKIGLKLKFIISSVDFRVLTRRKSVASY